MMRVDDGARRAVASRLGVRFAHVGALLRRPVISRALIVVDPRFVVDPNHLVGRAAVAGFRLGAELPGAGRRGRRRGGLGGRCGLPPREERAGLRRRRRRNWGGAGGAIEAEDGWACWVLHWARNCGQAAPPVVPAACACFHWAAQADMTLSALAPVEPAIAAPRRKAAAAADESRIRMDVFPEPGPEWAGDQPNRAPDRRQCDFAPMRNARGPTPLHVPTRLLTLSHGLPGAEKRSN